MFWGHKVYEYLTWYLTNKHKHLNSSELNKFVIVNKKSKEVAVIFSYIFPENKFYTGGKVK